MDYGLYEILGHDAAGIKEAMHQYATNQIAKRRYICAGGAWLIKEKDYIRQKWKLVRLELLYKLNPPPSCSLLSLRGGDLVLELLV